MNRTELKCYATQARKDFIQAMTDRAAYYGLTSTKIEPVVERGDIAVIAGREHPKAVARKRKQLEERIKRLGSDWTKSFEQLMDAMAYTWFNRFVAIRFMELHGYLEHGYRVLSHPEGKPSPEILEHAEHVDFPSLKKDLVIDLKLAGAKEAELYRLLLTSQCNALHKAMPFLFEKIDDETELLLPDNLLNSDSLIRKLVNEIDEEDWTEVEIIGWMYQFYISDKKGEVIGKVVASEDIPAATQLFTPNWIVKYLVQNTLGRQWMATYPQSALRQQMEYYIEPAEQTPEVQEQLNAITPASLNPEELTLLDPACGSGHILVEAYDLFKAIYQERGYRAKDIPGLILQKNLFGLEIDDRAAQLAAFALMMKARADDRRIFESDAKPNVVAFVDSKGMNADEIAFALNSPLPGEQPSIDSPPPAGMLFETQDDLFSFAATREAKKAIHLQTNVCPTDIAALIDLFLSAKTFGSLIQVPVHLKVAVSSIEKRVNAVLKYGDLLQAHTHLLIPLIQQLKLLACQYNVVVANPPYMSGKFYSSSLREFTNNKYKLAKADLYSCFMQRCTLFSKPLNYFGLITIPNWMFLSTFEDIRKTMLANQTVDSFLHNGRGVFGSDFGSCAFVFRNIPLAQYRGSYRKLFEKQGSVSSNDELSARFTQVKTYSPANADFAMIPGFPVAYWASKRVLRLFKQSQSFGDIAMPCVGMNTTNNGMFVRFWHEVPFNKIGYDCDSVEIAISTCKKWFPYNKGGEFRKWYGNNWYVVNYENGGRTICDFIDSSGSRVASSGRVINRDKYFKPSVTWSAVSSSCFGVRRSEKGFLFDNGGSSAFPSPEHRNLVTGFLCSKVAFELLKMLNPTLNFQAGNIAALPLSLNSLAQYREQIDVAVDKLVFIHKNDWAANESSWEFQVPLSFTESIWQPTINATYGLLADCVRNNRRQAKELEEQINRCVISAYELGDEISFSVSDDDITLSTLCRDEEVRRLLSYAIGCTMGRYSLDNPGLIYAHSGNQGFDPNQYQTFKADDDGIIPVLDTDWGIADDATNRIVEFLGVAWPKEGLEENLSFIADILGPTGSEQPRETIRRYLSNGFYKHHLSMYKKRPIYWMFSSGKQRAFQCLVYLHRYNEGTLARMRTEYVIPLQGQIAARIDQLEGDKLKATSTSHGKKLQKEQDELKKKQAELASFEEKLKNAADQKISLDLDDGVKVNYVKFGDLLAESKAITGGKDEE